MADQAIRQELLSVLGRKCFLHLDREGQQLYVTDFPLRNEDVAASVREKLEELGYEIVVRGQALWGIDPGKVKWHEWLEEKKRADAIYVTDETLPLVSLARLWEKNAPADENVLFARKILLSGRPWRIKRRSTSSWSGRVLSIRSCRIIPMSSGCSC